MDLIGKLVRHKVYGEGTIVEQSGEYISVKFVAEPSIKKFQYPSCFKSFLTLQDAGVAAATDEVVKKHEEEEQKKKEQAQREAMAHALTKRIQGKQSQSSKSIELGSFSSVSDFCEDFKRSLIAEIMHLKTTGGKHQKIFDGKRVEARNNRYVYTFVTDDELNCPDGTQISIWQGQTSVSGSILGCEDFTIIIATGTDLGTDVPSIEFSAEPWRLLNSLVDRLDEVMSNPSEIVRALICDGRKSVDYSNNKITSGQEAAVKMSQTQPITFVWGPPGTGKTQTLAKIALAHIERGHRVLMLSYSNVSVDGAIMRVHSLAPKNKPGVIVRYGYARRKDLLDHEYLTSYNLALRNHPELLKERRDLISEQKRVARSSPRFIQIRKRLTEIRNFLSDEEIRAVREASFVATTVSKAVVDKVIREQEFDVVIFDEASMAYIPQIIFSASLATRNFICMGDFRQLPPIVQGNNASHLNADIFQYCGITAAVDNGRNHKWLCLLDTQYRMHPRISDFASTVMYGGLLKSAENMERQRAGIVASGPILGNSIGFADLTGMMSVCTKTGDNSRVNVLSAFLSFALALEAAQNHEVGIITPYHAQSRLLHAMARDAAELAPEFKQISCATVHQFQGSEKDVIIYDAVDCYRMPYPGMLLTSTGNNYANRLFNVALTRAKGKFVGVANVAYMDNKNLSNSLMFERMIETQRRKPSCIDGQELSRNRKLGSSSIMGFYDEESGSREFVRDVLSAKKEIRIDIPDRPADSKTIAQLASVLQSAKSSGVKVFVRSEKKKNLPDSIRALAIENPYIANPIATIDKKITWFGLPSSLANFISEGNTLRTICRPIIRFEGSHTATSLYGFMEMSKTMDQSNSVDLDETGKPTTDTFFNYVLANKKCPSCGKPMKVQKSKRGRFFLGCTGYPACQETALPDVEFVEKYFYRHHGAGQRCPKCNYSLEAKLGQYGLYIQCCGGSRHKFKLDEI